MPPTIENVTTCGGRSASVAVKVISDVVFSGTVRALGEVNTGACWFCSLTFVTFTKMVCVAGGRPRYALPWG